MAQFIYKTLDHRGAEIEETIEAEDLGSAASFLRRERKLVISIKEAAGRPRGVDDSIRFTALDYLSFVRSGDIVLFFRQLSTLIAAGVTLSNSLRILEKQAGRRKIRKIIGQVCRDIERGSSFMNALKRHPRTFSPLVVGMIETGEASGMLDEILKRIASNLEERATFRTQVITSFIYPSIVVLMSIFVVIFLVGFVIPKFLPIIRGMGGKLPWNTQLLINLTDWFKEYGKLLFAGMGVFALLLASSYKLIDFVKYWIDRIKIKLPAFGKMFHYPVVIIFSRNLAILLRSGMSMLESLVIIRNSIGNEAARKAVNTMERRVTRGESLSAPIKSADYIFPPMVADMVAVGENTGNMDDTLDLVGDIHEQMLQTHIKRVNAIIEPAIILLLGGMVGFVAWALIAGVLTMYTRF
jgi:type IV pilus assembly protein PilC